MSTIFHDSRLGPGTLTLATIDFAVQASSVKLTPSVDSTDGTPTLAAPAPAPESKITWSLDISAIQDFEDAAGFVNYLMDNALAEVPFAWTPNTDIPSPAYSGTVQIIPIEIGGDVAVQIVSDVSLPVVGEPLRTAPVGLAGGAASSSAKKAVA
jgi:hypothetical protein